MTAENTIPAGRRAVLLAAVLLAVAWVATHLPVMTAAPDTLIRFVLSFGLGLLILRRHGTGRAGRPRPAAIAAFAILGITAALAGVILPVHQLEWVGVLLLCGACLLWALPGDQARNVPAALFLVYWAHPLPAQVLGPLQLHMQRLSVQGAELVLHMVNIRAWADGMVLRTGLRDYEVPLWCSGMRTATTVFLLALGLGLLRRLALWRIAVLVVAGLLQALLLNILRIALMVLLVPYFPNLTALAFLHGTANVIVLLAVGLLVLEMWAWERARSRKRIPELGYPGATALLGKPVFWRALYRGRWALPVLLVLLAGVSIGYRCRPAHRLEMWKGATELLRDAGRYPEAQRLGEFVQRLIPEDEEWRLTLLRLHVLQERYEEVLARLDEVPDRTLQRRLEKKVLRAYCLMGLGRVPEAAAVIAELPQDAKSTDPRLAMILAEMAYHADNPQRVADFVTTASLWEPNLARVRKLFPYLRRHRKWQAIADADRPVGHTDLVQALSSAEAAMNLNLVPRVADLATQVRNRWPDDPRVLEPLFYLAAKRPDTPWETAFAEALAGCVRKADNPDLLYGLFDKCFGLGRPDLAWMVYRRLAELDAEHPGLPMSVVLHGDQWFVFRKRFLGVPAADAGDRMSLKNWMRWHRHLAPWREVWPQIPLGGELAVTDPTTLRKQSLARALEAFRKRAEAQQLSTAMRFEYVTALEIAGEFATATQQLAQIAADLPAERERVTLALSEMMERRADWQGVYEVLRSCADEPEPSLAALLRLTQAELNLRLGLAALETARQAVRLYPYSAQAAHLFATVLSQYDSPEEALFFLEKPRARTDVNLSLLEVDLLFRTGRYTELSRQLNNLLLPAVVTSRLPPQRTFLPPAESAVLWTRFALPGTRDFTAAARILRANLPTATSPFLREMLGLWVACYEAGARGPAADPERWLACGRDRREQATALNQLCLLLARNGEVESARRVARLAVETWPESAVLWRVLVGLSEGDLGLVAAARRACPQDPELWLAELVLRTQLPSGTEAAERESWAVAEMRRVVEQRAFSAGTMTRAGDYLLRGGLYAAAAVAARDATERARTLLPSHLLGLACAMQQGDRDWALICTRRALEASTDPLPVLNRTYVEIVSEGREPPLDEDLVAALKRLRNEEPNNPLWAEMLTYIRFKRENWSELVDCLHEARAALEAGSTKPLVFLLGAEAARQLRLLDESLELLRAGRIAHPNEPAFLNNLAFVLAQRPDTIPEAVKLLPELQTGAEKDPQMLDTMITILIRSGRLDEAERTLGRLVAEAGPRERFRADLHRAEIALRRGRPDEARQLLVRRLRETRQIPDEDIGWANELLFRAEEAAATTSTVRRVEG